MRASDLFDDFAARHARGERPDAREYLQRAGEGADELAGLIDAYLRAAPGNEPAPETVAMMEAFVQGEPPLLHLRVQRGLRREVVVDALIRGLKLDVKKRDKVARYYHELETGLLEPKRVDERVFAVLAKALKTRVADLVASRMPPFEPQSAYFRADAAPQAAAFAPSFRALEDVVPEHDEIDKLFDTSK